MSSVDVRRVADLAAERTKRELAIQGTAELAELMSQPTPLDDSVIITEPGVYDGIPSAVYHRDPVAGGSLSSTGARLLVEQAGPAKYRYAIDHPGEHTTDTFDFGIAAHHKVLGDPDDRLVVIGPDEWRTNAAKDAVAQARAAGKTPIKPKQWAVVEEMAAAIEAHSEAATLLRAASGKPEQTLVWREAQSGIMCRSRIDWFRSPVEDNRLIVVDYKTCEHADDDHFAKSAMEYGYHLQDDFYRAGVRALAIDPDPALLFVAQEKKPPYLVNVIELDDVAKSIGRGLNRQAINTYAECRRTGRWPGYTGVSYVSLPGWYTRRYDED
jgi:hypothetical protein